MSSAPILHSYWRSSASYRVRIALNLKGLDYRIEALHLVRDGGEQHGAQYLQLNPQGLVPTLQIDDLILTQSLAMIEYLEERHPVPALLPSNAAGRARVRSIANAIACDIHPLNNLRVLKYLVADLGADEAAKLAWYRHWTEIGLQQIEALLDHRATGRFCHGDQPGLADCCLLPQVYNARRFDCNLSGLDRILRICGELDSIEAVTRAAPENQPDRH